MKILKEMWLVKFENIEAKEQAEAKVYADAA